MRRLVRIIAWLLVAVSILLGMFVIAVDIGSYPSASPAGQILGAIFGGVVPMVAAVVSVRNQRIASRLYLYSAPAALLLLCLFVPVFGGPLRMLTVFAGAFLAPWLFLRLAVRNGHHPLLPRAASRAGLRTTILTGSAAVCGLILLALVGSFSVLWTFPLSDCGGRPLLDDRGVPRHMDFTGRVLFVGPPSLLGRSLWALVKVDRRFPGPGSETPGVVILRGFFRPDDRSRRLFVEGTRSELILARYLPVIEPVPCGRTTPLVSAAGSIAILSGAARETAQ